MIDNRGQADPAGRGVAVYLATTKTGRRQAVIVESSEVADMLVAWRDAHRAQGAERRGAAFSRTGSVAEGTCAGPARQRSSGWQRPRLAIFVAFLPPRRRLAGVFVEQADVGHLAARSLESGVVWAPLRAEGRQMLIGSA